VEHLSIDVSPMAINRTAMYFVVQDTVRALIERGCSVELSGCGAPIDLAEFIANGYALTPPQSRAITARIMDIVRSPDEVRGFVPRSGVFVAFDPLYTLTRPPGTPTVAFTLDLTPLTRPEWHNPAVSIAYRSAFERLREPNVSVVSISHSTARDLWANMGIPLSDVFVAPLYNRLPISRRSATERTKTLLFVGSLEVRKNVASLGVAFAASGLAERGYQLHLIGGDAHGSDDIKRVVAQLPGVVLRGRVSDRELEQAYDECTALVYPSSWEGFGLPALEALARGIPLLASDTGALPEVAGDAAVMVDPCDLRSIERGLLEVVELAARDDEAAVRARLQQASTFSFDRYLDIVVSAIEHGGRTTGHRHPTRTVRTRTTQASDPADRRKLLQRRIVSASLGQVPGDSFSLDHLYALQSEARAQFNMSVARLRYTKPHALPASAARVASSLARLQVRNIVIRSMINETVARSLRERDAG
jgi:glycosyltransferase involved in cell wall biosynthesis